MKDHHSSYWKVQVTRLWSELASIIEGDVLWDRATRMLYASDASIFQQLPAAVVRPRHAQDCAAILKFANQYEIPLIPRAAGTSLAGQCVGSGLVIDVLHYMNQVLSLDVVNANGATVRVEPGVVLDELNNVLKLHGFTFPIDPSTSNRCTIGGMLGNNAWGIHTPRYGTTRDHVVCIDALMSDGTGAHFSELDEHQLKDKIAEKTAVGKLHLSVYNAVKNHQERINKALMPAGVLRSNTGYALTSISKNTDWKKRFNLAPFLCGSEGTLVFMTAITLKLSPLPSQRQLICAHFDSLSEAVKSVSLITELIAPYPVTAIELLDHSILDASATSVSQQQNRLWIEGKPEAVLLIECEGLCDGSCEGSCEENEAVKRIKKSLEQTGCYASPVITSPESDKAWALRRAGLAMLMGRPGKLKTVSAIEDAAVPLPRLAEYINAVRAVMQGYGLECVYYGPVSVGVVHIRPWMDLSQDEEKQRFIVLLKDIADIVQRLGGVISSKHGDGRIRGWLLPGLLDEKIYAILESIKAVADPKGILNPGSLLTSTQPDTDLRVSSLGQALDHLSGPSLRPLQPLQHLQQQPASKTGFNWHQQGGIQAAIHQCNGAGVCLKSAGSAITTNNTMCPSYQVTHNENHVTRGRANILRQMFQQQGLEALSSNEVQEALDLCLSCKACKKECPASVDMARLKAEALQQRHDQIGISLHTRLAANYYKISKVASKGRVLFNKRLFREKIPRLFGMHEKRSLPKLARQTFEQWFRQHTPHPNAGNNSKGRVLLINDAQINYYEPNIGIAALKTLEFLGFEVVVSPCLGSTQILISHGLLRKAKQQLANSVSILSKLAGVDGDGLDIIGLEPSELLTLRDEASDLFTGEQSLQIETFAKKAYLFEEFILKHANSMPTLKLDKEYNILIHEHCHQKSMVDPEITQKCLSLISNVKVSTIPSGCCGMAGSFGYEKDHYEISMQIAELILFPAIRNAPAETIIVATGASCRKQVLDGIGRKALHPVEVFILLEISGHFFS